jgi:hypothetical protein
VTLQIKTLSYSDILCQIVMPFISLKILCHLRKFLLAVHQEKEHTTFTTHTVMFYQDSTLALDDYHDIFLINSLPFQFTDTKH